VEQIGSPLALYDDPANLFVAGFIGSPAMNFFPGKLARDGAQRLVTLVDGNRLPVPGLALGDGHKVTLGVRPEHLLIGEAGVAAEVVVVEPTGADTQVYCKLADVDVTVVSRERHAFRPGDTIRLRPLPGKTYLFDAQSGKRLA
jgi:multiple sugar transport system ATP-binding protein